MAATDQPYRSQKALDVVFAVSSVLMLVSMVWMFAEDYNREYKAEQREFRDVLVGLAQRQALQQLPSKREFDQARKQVEDARRLRDEKASEIEDLRAQARARLADREKADARYQDVKADLDSRRSFYDLEV